MIDHSDISQIQNHKDLANYIDRLRSDLVENSANWENGTLESYFEAMAAFIGDSEGYYQNQGVPLPNAETWKTLAEILTAAKIYE